MTRQDVAPEIELDDDGVARLWCSVWRRARLDARGRAGARAADRRDATRWFESGRALDVLLSMSIERRRAEDLVAGELEAIKRTNGKGE